MNNPSPLESVFFAAMGKSSPQERAAYLDDACAKDPDLRRRVEKMLDAQVQAGSFLEQPACPVVTFDERSTTEEPGAVIGPYKLLEQIGEGGFGIVFMAEQAELVRRKVALKVLKPGMDTKQVVARFEAERQALAIMDHPNIAKILDGGATPSGRPYFVMELVRGSPVTEFCDQYHMSIRERLDLFVKVCQAVHHAHQKGVIHRDLKPSNVLVVSYDGTPVPKVIDFGIAKAMSGHLTDKSLFTGFAQMIGTPLYMSPEQAGQSGLDVDTRSDIYSLGVLLYELLTGMTPFDKEQLSKLGYDELRRIIREEEPPKPSTRISTLGQAATTASMNRQSDPRTLSKQVCGELDWIVMKSLEKDRNRRYESASAFAADVQRYLHDEPVQACPPSLTYRLHKLLRRNRRVLASAAVLVVTLTVAMAAVVENYRRETKALEDARERLIEKQKAEANNQAELARQFAKTESVVSEALARSSALGDQATLMPTTTSKEAAAAVAIWHQAERALSQAEAALVTGKAKHQVQEKVSGARRRLDQARGQTEQQLARMLREEKLCSDLEEANMARPTMAGDHIGAVAAAGQFAKAFKDYGLELKPDQMESLAKRIRAERPDLRDALIAGLDNWAFISPPRFQAQPGNEWASAVELRKIARTADDDPWRTAYRDAVSSKDTATLNDLAKQARERTLPAASVYLLALSLADRDQRAEAVALLRWARDAHPKDVWIPFHLALLLDSPRRSAAVIEEQIGCYRLFLALRPDSPVVLNNLGTCLASRGRVEESITSFRAALKLKPDYAMAHSNLGNSLGEKGLLDEALAANDAAIRLRPDSASFFSNRGVILLNKGLVDQAIAAQEMAVKLNSESAAAYSNLGNALRKKGMFKEAIAACQKAIRLDPTFATAHVNLGIILSQQEKYDAALASHEKAVHLDPDNAATHCNLALALADKKRFPEAETTCRLAIKLQPNLAAAHNALGVVLYLQEKNADAVTSFREALRHKPDYVNAHYNLGLIYLKQKQAVEAMTAMELTIKYDARHAEAHLQIGRILADRQQYAESVKFFKQAIVLKENLAEAHMLLGLSRWELNDLDAAAKSFKEGLRLDPNSAMTHFYLGRLHERQKQPEAAIASFNEAIRLQPDHAPAHYNLATLLADKNQLDAAANALRQAIKWDKNHAKAHNNLGIVLARQGKVADAIPCFREALRCDAKYPLARAMLAQALNFEAWPLVAKTEASRANAERAVKMASEAVELNPKLADYWNTLGVGNYRADNWDKSIAALNKSASMSKENDWCDFLFLAMAHWKKGDKAEARTWYDRAAKRIRDQRIDTEESRRFQAEAAALLGLPKEPK
jgi:tetratricopeptide (TPR) repeat protein/serine/threonine protein kinase